MTRKTITPKNKKPKRPGCGPQQAGPKSYQAIVRHYQSNFQQAADSTMNGYSDLTFDEMLEYAAYAKLRNGKRHPHQYRLKRSALRNAHKQLKAYKNDLLSCSTFHQLYEAVQDAISDIGGIGELMVYDTAHRIGAYLKLRPNKVYLHAGTRTGAVALGFDGSEESIDRKDLPKPFQKLKPEEIEDCLCIYKKAIRRIRGLDD